MLFGLVILLASYARNKKKISFPEFVDILLLTIFFGLLAFIPEQQVFAEGSFTELTTSGFLWAFIFNVLIFLDLVGIILLGGIRKEKLMVNIGSIALFILIIQKYFSFFGDLDRGFFFLTAGLLLIVVGWAMEKNRRRMLKEISNQIHL